MTTVTDDRRALQVECPAPAGGAASPPWLAAIRDRARDRFETLGLPTRRDEEWRFTNLRAIERTVFAAGAGGDAPPDALDRLAWPGLDADRLVFVNGKWRPDLSQVGALPEGVIVASLAEAIDRHGALLERHLARHAGFEDEAFTALNTACLEDGVLVFVPEGIAATRPVHVLSVTTATPEPVAIHPRLLIVAEAGSRVTVLEDHAGAPGAGVSLTNAVTEVVVGREAEVAHYLVERESTDAFNISTLAIHQEASSRFESHSALLGGAIVRNNVHPVLAGEHCHSLLNGLYVGTGAQHMDNHMRVEHVAAHCDSRQYYTGVLQGRAHGVFSGRIVVAKGAQKTDAVQSNGNLLLSDTAQAQTKPQLEIYADDVKCTHGATIGELNEEALFYLMARGLSEETARSMLVYAFASECLDRMSLDAVRHQLARDLIARLPCRGVLRCVFAGA